MSKCGSATLLIPPKGHEGAPFVALGADDVVVGLGALSSECGFATSLEPPRGADDVVVGLGALFTPRQ